ncbi:MAG TPA: DUF2304 domain-containing protein [Thermomicrobiales bacterium]|jgi:hypothetical protein
MTQRIQIISVLGSLAVMVFVFMLIRRGKLREEYAIIWFLASLALIAVSIWRDSLDVAADLAGIYYAPSVLLLGVIVLGFALAMHYSISLSRLAEQNKRLAQEVALLRHQIESLNDAGGPRGHSPTPVRR